MVRETVIRAIGNSAGITIPKPVLDQLHLKEGDQVYLVETDAGVLITPYDPTFREAMRIHEEGVRVYRDALHTLADR